MSLVWIADLVDEYRKQAQALPGVCDPVDIRRINANLQDGNKAGRALKLARFVEHVNLRATAELALVRLAINWRTRVVHSASNPPLGPQLKGDLRRWKAEIANDYSGLDVDDLMNREASSTAPTFKEMASITSAAHRLVRSVDEQVRARVDLVALADLLIADFLGTGDDFSRRTNDIWRNSTERATRQLERQLVAGGLQPIAPNEAASPRSSALADHLSSLAQHTLGEARLRFTRMAEDSSKGLA